MGFWHKQAETAVLGFSVFITLLYLPFAVPLQFAANQQDYVRIAGASCLVTAALTLLTAIRVGLPVATIPALGPALLLAPLVQSGQVSVEAMAIGCILTAAVTWGLAITGARRVLLDQLPEEIFLGIRAAVGSIVALTSLELIDSYPRESKAILFPLFYTAIAGMLLWDRWMSAKRRDGEHRSTLLYFLTQLHYLAIPVALAAIAFHWNLIPDSGPEFQKLLPSENKPAEQALVMLPVCVALLFLLVTDIPGHPYDIMQSREVLPRLKNPRHIDRRVRRGFKVDAIGTAVSGLCFFFHIPVPPPLYVTENNLIRDFNFISNIAGFYAALLFAGLGACLLVYPGDAFMWSRYAFLAVAPVLAFISIKMIARSMIKDQEVEEDHAPAAPEGSPPASAAPSRQLAPPQFKRYADAVDFYIPAALIILLTSFPKVPLVLALPVTVVASCLFRVLRKADVEPAVWVSFVCAAISMFCWFVVQYL